MNSWGFVTVRCQLVGIELPQYSGKSAQPNPAVTSAIYIYIYDVGIELPQFSGKSA